MLYQNRPGASPLQEQRIRFPLSASSSGGGIRFEQEKYDEFLRVRTHGREKWQMQKSVIQV